MNATATPAWIESKPAISPDEKPAISFTKQQEEENLRLFTFIKGYRRASMIPTEARGQSERDATVSEASSKTASPLQQRQRVSA